MKWIFIVFLLIASVSASAQQVYKCVNGKEVSYQSAPCSASQTTAKQWDAVPEPPPTSQELWRRQNVDKKVESASADRGSLAARRATTSGAAVRPSPENACDSAKRRRHQFFDAHPNRSFDASRKMDDMVVRACK